MILRLFLLFGVVLLSVTGYFIVVQVPPNVQAPPAEAEYTRLAAEGILPTGNLAENEEVEHDVFGVPPEDEEMLERTQAAMAEMPGMNMAGMDMPESTAPAEGAGGMAGMDMSGTAPAEGAGDMAGMDMPESTAPAEGAGGMAGMDMPESTTPAEGAGDMNMADDGNAMDMDMDGDGIPDMRSADMAMNTPDGADDEMSEEAQAAREAQQMAGLIVDPDGPFDREIALTMSEWTFSNLNVEATQGERIRVTLRNEGKVLHEFMFMGMAQMQAVAYRSDRADWNLLEHEALYEKSLLLPGAEISFVVEVTKPGVWMFMCMLPYHMQMGMMGQIFTPGMAMEM